MIKKGGLITKKRRGWNNRHLDGLPKQVCNILISFEYKTEKHLLPCLWNPIDINSVEALKVKKGYLGTATRLNGIAVKFNTWEQNNSEFIYYKIIQDGDFSKII